MQEKHRADDRHSERMPPVFSPPAARTPAAATATLPSPGTSSEKPEVPDRLYNAFKKRMLRDLELLARSMKAAATPDRDAASSTTTGASTSRRSWKLKCKRASEKATSVSTDEELFRDPHAPSAKKRKRKKSDDSGEEEPKDDKAADKKNQPAADDDDAPVPPSQ